MSAPEQAEEALDEAAPPASRLLALKLKRLLVAPIALLRRLRRRPEAVEEAPEEPEPPRGRSARAAEEEEEEAPAPAPSRWRRPLAYLAVLLAGGAAGAGSAYWGLGEVVSHQSAEIQRQQLELAKQAKSLAEAREKLKEETATRIEAENRLALILADPSDPRLAAIAPRGPAARGGRSDPEKGGDCTLRSGSIGANLKDCIEAFNR